MATKKYTDRQLELIAKRVVSELREVIDANNAIHAAELERTYATSEYGNNVAEFINIKYRMEELVKLSNECAKKIRLSAAQEGFSVDVYPGSIEEYMKDKFITAKLPYKVPSIDTITADILLYGVEDLSTLVDSLKQKYLSNNNN